MPQSRTHSTSNAISFPAIRSALSEAKRFRVGGRQLRPEQERALRLLVRPAPSSRDNPIAGYLSAAAADEDPNLLLLALCDAAKARGRMEVAKAAGLNRESLYNALKPGAHPRFETVHAVLRALGVKLAMSARAADAGDEARRAALAAEIPEFLRSAGEQMSALVTDQVALTGADKSSPAQAEKIVARVRSIDDFRPGTVRGRGNKGKAAEPIGKAEPAGKARTQTQPRGR
jgi:probable addiction module antidote protein